MSVGLLCQAHISGSYGEFLAFGVETSADGYERVRADVQPATADGIRRGTAAAVAFPRFWVRSDTEFFFFY